MTATTASAATASSGLVCGVIATTGAGACFDTQDQLNAWVMSQMGTTSISAVPAGQTSASPVAAVPDAGSGSFLLGKLYQNANFGGASQEIYGTSGCAAPHTLASGWDWERNLSQAPAFNDETSSFQGYSNCSVQLFENSNYTGATLGPLTSSSYVGDAMNDRTSAVRFY